MSPVTILLCVNDAETAEALLAGVAADGRIGFVSQAVGVIWVPASAAELEPVRDPAETPIAGNTRLKQGVLAGMRNFGITTYADLAERDVADLLDVRGLGANKMALLIQDMHDHGVRFRDLHLWADSPWLRTAAERYGIDLDNILSKGGQ
jgi:hypothetical protein